MEVFYCIWYAMSLLLENDQKPQEELCKNHGADWNPGGKIALQGMAFLFDYLGKAAVGNRSRKTTDLPFHNKSGDEYSHPPSCFVSGWITWTKHNKTKPCYRFCLKNNMNSLHKSMLFHPATIPAHFSIPWQAIIPRSSRRAFHRCEAGMWNFATKGSLSLPEPWVQDTGLEPKDFWALP